MSKPNLENIVIRELHPEEHKLAERLEDLQRLVGTTRRGRIPTHPHVGKRGLLQIVDPGLGKPGFVLVALDKTTGTPVGFYIGLKGAERSLLTLFSGVHPGYRSSGIGTMLHSTMEEIAGKNGISAKQSTISPHNIPSLKVNVNHQGFRVSDWKANRYGPSHHRFYIRGRFNYPTQEIDPSTLAGLTRVFLERSKTLPTIERRIRVLNAQQKEYLLELVETPRHPLETAYRYVDWKKFQGVYVHTEGDRHFLLMRPASKIRVIKRVQRKPSNPAPL